MRYSFRLAQLLGHSPDPKRRPGTIKSIVEHTGLDRHKIAALLRNDVKYLPLDAISLICGYLIDQGLVPPEKLPGALFGVEPESFWEMLARRTSLHICLGTREAPDSDFVDDAWIVTADSLLLGAMLNGVSTLGGAAKYYPKSGTPPVADNSAVARAAPHPEEYVQWLVVSPRKGKEEYVKAKAWEVYGEFDEVAGDKALVCLGSVKSNPVIEIVLAKAFEAEPFVSADDASEARQRKCPIWFRFREGVDPELPSCAGGLQLSQHEAAAEPGIYYETRDGSWSLVPWTSEADDAGLVFYEYFPALGRLELVAGGFSSRSTRFLSQVLRPAITSRLWPPTYDSPARQLGLFLFRFSFGSEEPRARDILSGRYVGNVEVLELDPEVISRRMTN